MASVLLMHVAGGRRTIIDHDCCPIVRAFSWHMNGGYVTTSMYAPHGKRILRLHHLLLPAMEGFDVDHINGNRLDNRRGNLRYLTRSLNALNRHTERGVKVTRNGKYEARASRDGVYVHLGTFDTYAEAIAKRREWEGQLWT
jgi:hypothetical protein